MFVFDDESARRILTPWSKEVSKRLIDRDLKQADLLKTLQSAGFKVTKGHISNLMYGIGVTTRVDVIREIDYILDIK